MILWLASPAWAHRPGLSYARLDADHVALTFAQPELSTLVPIGADLDASRIVVAEVTLDAATFTVGGEPCTLGDPTLRRVEDDGVEIAAPLDCPPGEVTYTAGFLPKLAPGHRHYVEALGQPVAVLDSNAPTAAYTGASDPGAVAAQFLGLGVEHIWTGYDHLLFLLGLLLAAKSLRSMLFIVTGFTVAHSITLSAAALGLVSLPSGVVEPAIAASIAYVGIENFWKPAPKRRVAVTFLLGLVHGFGFAGILAELGLPRDALTIALVCFNGGVELGQAAVVALALPLLLWMRRWSWWEARAVPAASVFVTLAGLYWLVERVVGGA
ncbi:MAG: HupE/UreJ family protein [Pseudomonadota bacterium]|nr:HupE/UreJ family protein [Pseudomonadota bacterium]